MTTAYEAVRAELVQQPATWLVTGAAGFIGSHLVEELLRLNQKVIGLDNFATGHLENIVEVRDAVGDAGQNLTFLVGDIADLETCRNAVQGVDYVLHQAALGSVPRSIEDPLASHRANVDGFLNMLVAARDVGVKGFVYASSSSVYGDDPNQPKVEGQEGAPLSPYALTKSINEQYALLFARVYGFHSIGLRYFNVFGPRQDPNGPYAAVIPRWIDALLNGTPCVINGDGETSRDFCYVANVVQANILAATTQNPDALDRVYNIAVGERTSLTELYELLRDGLAELMPERSDIATLQPVYGPFRAGDIRHSLADIGEARLRIGYSPTTPVAEGLDQLLPRSCQCSPV
jgi:UDP-N-acetylglucosamine 4-epimerase